MKLQVAPGVAAPFVAVNRNRRAVVLDLKQPEGVATLEHAQARGMVQEVTPPLAGRVKALGNPVKLSASPATMRKAGPVLGP